MFQMVQNRVCKPEWNLFNVGGKGVCVELARSPCKGKISFVQCYHVLHVNEENVGNGFGRDEFSRDEQ